MTAQHDSPFAYLQERRERERLERDPLKRAYADWCRVTRGSYVSSQFQFAAAVRVMEHYFELRAKYRDSAVYPCDTVAVYRELRNQTEEQDDG